MPTSSLRVSYRVSTRLSRNPSEPCVANKEIETGRLSYNPSGMLTCRNAERNYKFFQRRSYKNKQRKKEKKKIVMSQRERERERERTWQNPDADAINSKLNVLSQKFSEIVGSVCNFDGGPRTVGIARTPKSWIIIIVSQASVKVEFINERWCHDFCYYRISCEWKGRGEVVRVYTSIKLLSFKANISHHNHMPLSLPWPVLKNLKQNFPNSFRYLWKEDKNHIGKQH